MADSAHLLFPFFSSIVFVVAGMFAKQATSLGASPYTATIIANVGLAVVWTVIGFVRAETLPMSAYWPAAWIAFTFVAGQLCTYLAFQYGDVSLATPVFGVKIIMVAMLSSLLASQAIELQIWIAAVLAAIGIGVIQMRPGTSAGLNISARRATLAIILALLAATSLSCFDIGVQIYGRQYGAPRFLATMFVFTGLLSLGLLPWADRPRRLRELNASQPLLIATFLMIIQAMSITYSLAEFGDATRINIVYSLRGLWSVVVAWLISRYIVSPGGQNSAATLLFRFIGAVLLTLAVFVALVG